MTLDYQKNILRYLFQYSVEHLPYIEPQLFSTVEFQSLFKIYSQYVVKYKSLPNKDNFIQFFSEDTRITEESKDFLKDSLLWVYDDISDIGMIKETLLTEVKKKMFKNMMSESMSFLEDGITAAHIDEVHKAISKINALDARVETPGIFLLKDLNRFTWTSNIVYPTYLNALNNMTAAGGFYPPQSIMLLGAPKTFKTGFLIKLALEYMRSGIDVMYNDFENGQDDIFERFKQTMLECTVDELEGFNTELNEIKDKMISFTNSGEIYIKKYRKKVDHIETVELELDKVMEMSDFNPKAMFYDYIDIMGSADRRLIDTRKIIQDNYAKADNLNNKYSTFSFTVSKIKQEAANKEWLVPEDVAEDYEKIYNVHGAFGIIRTEEDLEQGLGKIQAIVQRKGISREKIACPLIIDPARCIIHEI